MTNEIDNKIDSEQTIKLVCNFLKSNLPESFNPSVKEAIKEVCKIRLCKALGVSGLSGAKSSIFDFYSCVLGEAICNKLAINTHIANDSLRLVKYDNVNLVNSVRNYLDTELVEEAMVDTFKLLSKFTHLVENPNKKVSVC